MPNSYFPSKIYKTREREREGVTLAQIRQDPMPSKLPSKIYEKSNDRLQNNKFRMRVFNYRVSSGIPNKRIPPRTPLDHTLKTMSVSNKLPFQVFVPDIPTISNDGCR